MIQLGGYVQAGQVAEGITVIEGSVCVEAELHLQTEFRTEKLALVQADAQQDGGHLLAVEAETEVGFVDFLGIQVDLEPVAFVPVSGDVIG